MALVFGQHRVCRLCGGRGYPPAMSAEEQRKRNRELTLAKRKHLPAPPLVRDKNCLLCGGSGFIVG